MNGYVFLDDGVRVAQNLDGESVDLVYLDPPFNTGRRQVRKMLKTVATDAEGDRTGFGGKRYDTYTLKVAGYQDSYDDYLNFLAPFLIESKRILKPSGSLYLHLDYREAHYAKVLLDEIFGRDNFLNEIIWAYDYGGRPKSRWPAKHNNIFFYAKDAKQNLFNTDEVERIPYMAPGLVTPEKAAKGKLPTDTWWHTIVSPTGKEKTGWASQKPIGVLKRIVAASSPPNGLVVDLVAGSGTTGAAALELSRSFILADSSREAYDVMKKRFASSKGVVFHDRQPLE